MLTSVSVSTDQGNTLKVEISTSHSGSTERSGEVEPLPEVRVLWGRLASGGFVRCLAS